MSSAQSAVSAAAAPTGWRGRLIRVIQFPLTRIILAVIVVSIALNATRGALKLAGLAPSPGTPQSLSPILIGTLATIVVVHLAYLLYVRYVEQREPTEFGAAGALVELASGALIGALLLTLTIGALWVGGWYRVTGSNPWTALGAPLVLAAGAAYVEELVVRGILFRNIDAMLGSWLALAITAALFGLAHISNPHATVVSAVAIALEAGVLLGAAYMVTQRLWLAIGIHFAWNFAQGGIFGVAVSGVASNGLLRGELRGPQLVSGGPFGAEGSVIAVIVCLAASVPLVIMARRRGSVARPMWRRPLTAAEVPQLNATAAFTRASISGAGENP
jgi:uncharacterized protein